MVRKEIPFYQEETQPCLIILENKIHSKILKVLRQWMLIFSSPQTSAENKYISSPVAPIAEFHKQM